jgi:CheY-like chemotaxis protein
MAILAGLDMLERRSKEDQRQRIMEGMRQAAQRGARLTRHLLAFSRKQQLKPEVIDLRLRINSMRGLLERSLRGDIEVRFEFAEGLWPIEVDPDELELMVLNLALNARDAMPNGGTITVRAENRAADNDQQQSGDLVCLTITDTGTGMTPEVRAHVFEPFFTTKDVGRGSGLGLAQVHGFATQSGGSVRIESEVDRGTSVLVLLPRSMKTPQIERPEIEPNREKEGLRAAGSVLLVEDDEEVSKLLTEMLEQLGFEVTRTASAAAALGALANGRRVDVVLSDIMMPGGMNGVELAREIKARRADLPVLLTSGYAEASKFTTGEQDLRVLPKPFGINDLASALRSIVRS